MLGALKKLYEEGYAASSKISVLIHLRSSVTNPGRYQVVILSNQGGITLKTALKQDPKRLAEFKAKIGALMNHFNFPVNLYAATERDHNRKPRTGMWSRMLEDFNLRDEEGVNLEQSFYVGDAAGRIGDDKGDVNDFASSDRSVH